PAQRVRLQPLAHQTVQPLETFAHVRRPRRQIDARRRPPAEHASAPFAHPPAPPPRRWGPLPLAASRRRCPPPPSGARPRRRAPVAADVSGTHPASRPSARASRRISAGSARSPQTPAPTARSHPACAAELHSSPLCPSLHSNITPADRKDGLV